jgi:hypothetical protein
MLGRFNLFLDRISDFLAARKGLLPILGLLLILANFVLQFFPGLGWIVSSDLLLHLGAMFAILGFLLAWAL